jgi:hypothetical protein
MRNTFAFPLGRLSEGPAVLGYSQRPEGECWPRPYQPGKKTLIAISAAQIRETPTALKLPRGVTPPDEEVRLGNCRGGRHGCQNSTRRDLDRWRRPELTLGLSPPPTDGRSFARSCAWQLLNDSRPTRSAAGLLLRLTRADSVPAGNNLASSVGWTLDRVPGTTRRSASPTVSASSA